MQSSRRAPSDISDYLEIFLRRKYWIVLPAIAIASIMTMISLVLPKSYRSETLILVDAQRVPEKYVQSTVTGDVSDRLQNISQEILSRTRLEKVIDQFKLYQEQKRNKVPMEDIVETMRKEIQVDVVTDQRARSGGGFRLAYVSKSPIVAQAVTKQLASLFIEENLKSRAQIANNTTDFINSELGKAKQSLQEQEAKVRDFRARYMGALPEQQQANLQVMSQLQGILQSNNDAISRAQQQKSYLESMQEALAKRDPITGPLVKTAASLRLEQAKAELVAAQQKYTDRHPDVIRLQSAVRALEREVADEAKSPSAAITSSNGSVMDPTQLKTQIRILEEEIKNRNSRSLDLEKQINGIKGRVELQPQIEQQFAELTRDYDVSKKTYDSLLDKSQQSGMAAEMESSAKGEQFRVLDPASLPEKPTKPNLLMLNLGGLIAGIAVGGGLGMLQELRDRSIHSERDLQYYIPLPVIGALPDIATKEKVSAVRKRRLIKLAFSSVASAMIVAAIAFLYWKNYGGVGAGF
jgi:succinoglycan biosynthesis transport protein ExoP